MIRATVGSGTSDGYVVESLIGNTSGGLVTVKRTLAVATIFNAMHVRLDSARPARFAA